MDKKNIAILVLLLLAAGVCFYLGSRLAPPPAPAPIVAAPGTGSPFAKNEAPPAGPAKMVEASFSAPPKTNAPAEFVSLANDAVEVKFTSAGGAIDSIALKKHHAVKDQPELYVLNTPQAAPALSLVDFPGLDKDTSYSVVSQSATDITYRTVLDGRLEVTRHYALLAGPAGDPYQIRHETTFHNLSSQLQPLPRASFNLGTVSPLNENDSGVYILAGYYNGDKTDFTRRDSLAGGGLFSSSAPPPFLDKVAPVTWAAVKNQFFTTILTPDEPGVGVRIERVKVNLQQPDTNRSAFGLTASAQFDLKPLAAGASVTWGATYYAGPKEYRRLANTDHFKHNEDAVMEFSSFKFIGFFSKLLLTIMYWVHSWLPSWGWAVVVTTLLLKIVTLPFTLAASRSSKRMQKIMPLVKEVREKYKDSPAKQQEAMMRVYKENKVNPLGGCIPILITLPFFFGFFSMLQSASDLRFASFLWVKDLAAPDTVISFGTATLPLLGLTHLNLNILPLLMGVTMIYQMRITPTPSTDPSQAAMMKFMPLMYMLFCYNFAAALALYSTINGLFTIIQQKIVNSLPEPELPAPKAGGMKNVTPKKKKS